MDLRGLGYYLQTANQRQAEQRQAQGEMQAFIQKAMIEAHIKQQTQQAQPIDPSQILSQLELRNIVSQLQGQPGGLGQPQMPPQAPAGQLGALGGQMPAGMPTGQLPMQQPITGAAAAPALGGAGIPATQPMAQPQIGQQPLQRQYESVHKGTGKYGQPEYETKETLASELTGKRAHEQIKLSGKQAEQAQKYKSNFYQTVGLFKRTVAQIKGKGEEQGGLGLIPGIKGVVAAKVKIPGYGRTAGMFGQRLETALRMNNMLTGQNRAIKSLINMIYESMPGDFDPPDQIAAKISQSLKNAYVLSKFFAKSGLSPSALNKMSPKDLDMIDVKALVASYNLTPEEKREIEMIINDVLATPMAPARTLLKSAQPLAQPKQGIAPRIGGMFQGERIINVEVIQ